MERQWRWFLLTHQIRIMKQTQIEQTRVIGEYDGWEVVKNMPNGYGGGDPLDQAIRWLRQAKGAHVAILYNRISNVWYYIVYYLDNTLSATGYPSHDHAQSAGLDTAIDYLKKQQILK